MTTKRTNSATLGFEAELWKTTDALLANMDAAEYKHSDRESGMVGIGGQTYYTSEALFGTDYQAYKELGTEPPGDVEDEESPPAIGIGALIERVAKKSASKYEEESA